MTEAREPADFVARASYDALSPEARQALKIRIPDALSLQNNGPAQKW